MEKVLIAFRDIQGAGVLEQFLQTGEMVWKINEGIAAWCEEAQGSRVVIYLTPHCQMENGWESVSPAEKHRGAVAGHNSGGDKQSYHVRYVAKLFCC